jgi:hypothetical protein
MIDFFCQKISCFFSIYYLTESHCLKVEAGFPQNLMNALPADTSDPGENSSVMTGAEP